MLTISHQALLPRLAPEGISWRRVGRVLEVEIDIVNPSPAPTEPDELVIETAPFGAFVPFEPAGRVLITALGPFERRRITTAVIVPVSDAPGADERLERGLGETAFDTNDLQRFYELMGSGQWAGNLSVYFDRASESAAIELHRAYDLRVEASRPVLFCFMLGEECSLEPRSSHPVWGVEVLVPSPGYGVVHVNPPAEVGARAVIEVFATRTADEKTVRVEFGLETVGSQGQSIGCVKI